MLSRGHKFMTLSSSTAQGPYYPNPDGGEQTTPDGFNYSETAGDSPFAATKDAIIYSLCFGGAAGTLTLRTHGGDFLMSLPATAGVPAAWNFKDGLRVPEGFQVYNGDSVAGIDLVVAYDVA
jgi:hypothetical protein